MYSEFQERGEYEDELYKDEDDSSSCEVDSELEFRLYSQLHYSSGSGQAENWQEQPEDLEGRLESQQAVIVIDSDPEVITLSDNTEDDEGVCISKGKRPQLPDSANGRRLFPQSTPQVVTGGRVSGADSVISLESDSDSTLGSDSVENWMILGQSKLDGDCSIQLNLDGTGNGSAAEGDDDTSQNWTISTRDMKAQISNRQRGGRNMARRYYTNKTVTCHSCQRVGHLSKNCPRPKKLPSCLLCGKQGHIQRSCPHRHCSNCGMPGHGFNDCLERASWTKQCHRCAMTGHFQDECPEIWRQYHLTTTTGPLVKPDSEPPPRSPAYCYNCSRRGHFGFECMEKRMFSWTYPTTPYISHYDTEKDICRRDKRMLKKVQDLQEAGFLVQTKPGQTADLIEGTEEENHPRKKRKSAKGRGKKQLKDKPTTSKVKREEKPIKTERGQENKKGKKPHMVTKLWQEKRKERWQKKRRQATGVQPQAMPWDPEDFPRGPKKMASGVPTPPHKGKATPGLFSQVNKDLKGKKRRPRGRDRKPANLYPADENLFLIKQKSKR